MAIVFLLLLHSVSVTGSTLYALSRFTDTLFSYDAATGSNATIGKSLLPGYNPVGAGLSTIDVENGLAYALICNRTWPAAQLVTISTKDGSVVCKIDVPILGVWHEIVGYSSSLHFAGADKPENSHIVFTGVQMRDHTRAAYSVNADYCKSGAKISLMSEGWLAEDRAVLDAATTYDYKNQVFYTVSGDPRFGIDLVGVHLPSGNLTMRYANKGISVETFHTLHFDPTTDLLAGFVTPDDGVGLMARMFDPNKQAFVVPAVGWYRDFSDNLANVGALTVTGDSAVMYSIARDQVKNHHLIGVHLTVGTVQKHPLTSPIVCSAKFINRTVTEGCPINLLTDAV